jgi:hypothetical protein
MFEDVLVKLSSLRCNIWHKNFCLQAQALVISGAVFSFGLRSIRVKFIAHVKTQAYKCDVLVFAQCIHRNGCDLTTNVMMKQLLRNLNTRGSGTLHFHLVKSVCSIPWNFSIQKFYPMSALKWQQVCINSLKLCGGVILSMVKCDSFLFLQTRLFQFSSTRTRVLQCKQLFKSA